ncbi:MAG: hypothetical protein ACI9NQ_002158 [Paracoccaceae bacterium]
MSQEELIELFRSQDSEALKHCVTVLDDAGIIYHLIADEGGFDLGSIGSDDASETVINIEASRYEAGRTVLETDALKTDLPKDYHLLNSSDEELIEVITHSSEWSAFDTAHARKLLGERGVDVAKLEENRAERIAHLKQGQVASKALITSGWVFAILGGILGIAIGYALTSTKNKGPDGEFLKYDKASRETGAKMFKVGVCVAIVGVVIRVVFQDDF